MFKENTKSLNIKYETNNNDVSFKLEFGKGKDSLMYSNENDRTNIEKTYTIEVYEQEEKKGYRIICDDSPLVIKLSDISVNGINNNKYDYALGFAVDNMEPEYDNEMDIIPNNIERDGTMWSLPANNKKEYKFDQNPRGEYQWQTKRACEEGYKPTDKEKELGIEETTEKTGLIYVTFMLMCKEKVEEPVTRGVTRGVSDQEESERGRFGYGNSASTKSEKSDYKYLNGSEKYILPLRIRISKESEETNINCSQTIRGANINDLKKRTMVVD